MILQKKIAGLSAAALDRFALRARKAAGLHGTVNVLVTSSSAMRSLNLRFRKIDKPTDVLSFPSESNTANGRTAKEFAGEIAISADIAAHNAAGLGHSTAVEVKILALHGVLHLAGFDHERDNGEMARKETTLRRFLGLPAALIERELGAREQRSRIRKSQRTR